MTSNATLAAAAAPASLPARLFALAAYALSAAATIALMAFLLDLGPWKTIVRGGPAVAPGAALAGNLLLVLLFAGHHSACARPAVRRWLATRLPDGTERALYVAVASALLLLLMALWQPMPTLLWQVEHPLARGSLLAMHAAGWLLVAAATFQLDHWSLFGLRQAWRPETMPHHGALATPWLYRRVRHPLMSGFLLLLWTLPGFTQGHALLAGALTLYILVGIRLEERDLRREFGDAYRTYARRVPALLPWRGWRRARGDAEPARARPALTIAARLGPDRPGRRAPLVLVLPAMGVAAGFYDRFGAALAQAVGGSVWLVDLPGQGSSPLRARRGDDFGYADVVDHGLPALVEAAARLHPGRPLFLVGHSLGGQLALLALEHLGPRVAGLVLIASGTAHAGAWPRALRWRAWSLVWPVVLAARVLPWFPGARLGFGGDQARRWMRDWSHNSRHGGYRLHARHGADARAPDLREVTTPVLALQIDGDPVAPWEAGQALLSLVPQAPVRHLPMRGVLSDAPWRRHFSWARQPAEAVRLGAAWISARTRARQAS
jgi:predicted alpha/beta hydrolase/protein-S-isoprenylcysteine O-methyltransferase Ste14